MDRLSAETLNYDNLTEKIFKVNLRVLFSSGSGLDISPYVKRTRIDNDYINNVMPKFRIVLDLPIDVTMLIQKDRDQVVFALDIQYTDVNPEEETVADLNTKIYDTYMERIILKPLMMDDTIYNSLRIDNPDNTVEQDMATASRVKFEMIAVPEEALKSNKYITSGAYRNANITEAILALTTKTNYQIYLVEPDNQELFNQIILYPGNIYSNLYHLHNTYGIYNDDLKVYSINDKLIISPLNSDKVLDNRAPIDINVKFDTESPVGFHRRGSYDELDPVSLKTIKHIVVNHHNISLQSNTGLIAEVFGTNSVITSRDTAGLYEEEFSQDYYDRNGELFKTKLYENIFNNEYNRRNFLNKIRNQNLLTVRYQNIDLHLDDGLRKFIMNFDNKDYKRFDGEYKCLSTVHEFSTQTSGLTTITGTINLRKL